MNGSNYSNKSSNRKDILISNIIIIRRKTMRCTWEIVRAWIVWEMLSNAIINEGGCRMLKQGIGCYVPCIHACCCCCCCGGGGGGTVGGPHAAVAAACCCCVWGIVTSGCLSMPHQQLLLLLLL